MDRTPKKKFYEEALQGNWDIFPIPPDKEAEALRKKFKKKTLYKKSQTFALVEKLESYIGKKEKNYTLPKLFALYRAFLSVILENMENIDDSYGEVGDLTITIFKKYIELNFRELFLDTKGYFVDIIKYVIWEDYGVTDDVYPEIFNNLTESEIREIELLLQSERENLINHNLNYQAENALTMLGYLYAKNFLFHNFIPLAKEMGTRKWQRIIVLSETAEKKGEYEIALNVFETALKESGYHTEYLHKEYEKLKKRIKKG